MRLIAPTLEASERARAIVVRPFSGIITKHLHIYGVVFRRLVTDVKHLDEISIITFYRIS